MARAITSPLERSVDRLKLVDTEAGICAIGAASNINIIVWWSQANGIAVGRLARVTEQMRTKYPQGFTHIHLVKDRAGMPTPEARAGFVQIMKEYAESVAHLAVVIGGTGFWASTMRSAITGMRFISPRSFQMRLHGTPEEIVSWLPTAHYERTGELISPAALTGLLEQAQAWLSDGYADPNQRI